MRRFLLVLALTFISYQTFAEEKPAGDTSAPTDASSVGAPGASADIKLGEARTKKSLLALPELNYLGSPSASSKGAGTELFKTIKNDLEVSAFFQLIPTKAYLEDSSKTTLRPFGTTEPKGFKFPSWKTVGADFLIRAGYYVAGNEVNLEAYLYNVTNTQLVLGRKYKGSLSSVRKIAHIFSNDVVEALTGKKGMFLSRIVASSDKGVGDYREIYVMDWDSANSEKLTNHRSISLSPAWSPDGKKIAYTAYVVRAKTKMRNADMFIYDFKTGKSQLTSYRMGLNSGAAFAPDNKSLYLTISQQGAPDLYKMAFDGSLLAKLTNGPNGAMNVEPAISPDGSKIAFSSDRSGRPMIYTMNADGSDVKRITFAGVYNSTPAWSPDGKKIAFAGQSEDHFDIFVMDADGTNMVRLTSAKKSNGKYATNEDPSFSPDGRFVMYTSNRTGKNQIYISTVDGSEERRITLDEHNYYKPKWSNNLE